MLNKNTIDEKKGILNVRISTESGDKIDIEVQVVRKDSIIDRMIWYWAKLYSSELKAGEDYSKLKRTICILIADFEIDKFNMLTEFYTRWSITNNCHKEVKLKDKLDICIIKLSKMEKKENYTDEERKALNWCKFLKFPDRMEENIMSENPSIKAAKDEWEKLNLNDEDREISESREIYERDMSAVKETGYREGKEEGIEKVAIELLKEKVDIQLISRTTGLSIEELEKLKDKIQ